jgi:hypothetical protein
MLHPSTLVRHPSYGDADEEFLRALVFPEEDRRLFTSAPWRGEYRWFRATNVVCLELYRRVDCEPL